MPWTSKIRPNLSDRGVRRKLKIRRYPYWNLSVYGRAIGYERHNSRKTYWVARYRTKEGRYCQKRLGATDDRMKADGINYITYDRALELTWEWFRSPAVVANASDAKQIGHTDWLSYCPVGDVFTVGHALHDYIEWKRLAAARQAFLVIVSLINYYLVPRLGALTIVEFNGDAVRQFVREVLETAPKNGNPLPSRHIEELSEESLRKRKAIVNVLIGILRTALRMAWENGRTNDDRSWRKLRRLPNRARPRTLHLSRQECRILLRHCGTDLKQLVLGALYSGCRVKELIRMRAFDVGKDGYGVYVMPCKSLHHRFVFLPDEGMAFFLNLQKQKPGNELLFIRSDGRHWHGEYAHAFKKAVLAAGLPQEFSFHGLRHTYASQLVQAGAPLSVVAEQLGHVNTLTVGSTYGHLAPQVRESEVRQRFTPLSPIFSRAAFTQRKALKKWRSSLHGSDWRTYARITDLHSRSNTI